MGQICSNDNSSTATVNNTRSEKKEPEEDSNEAVTETKQDPNIEYYDYVIIGGGVAGGYALDQFHRLKSDKSSPFYNALTKKSLLLISNEAFYPYERPILTKDFLSNANKMDLPMFNTCYTNNNMAHDKDWYKMVEKDFNIHVKLQCDATHLDFDNKLVYYQNISDDIIPTLQKTNSVLFDEQLKSTDWIQDSRDKVKYGKLLLCTGTHARNFHDLHVKGSDAPNIYYLRDYNDAMRVREDIINTYDKIDDNNEENPEMKGNAESEYDAINGRVVIIGGGYRGQEVCSSILNHNLPGLKEIVLTFPEEYLMEVSMFKTCKETLGDYYLRLFKNRDKVSIICGGYQNHFIKEFIVSKESKNNIATKVVLMDGTEIIGKHFIVGIGTKSNHKLFKLNSVLEYDRRLKGMPVNGYMETKMRDVFAAGDIIEFFSTFSNSMQKLEQVRHARDSGIHAMKSMIGKDCNMLDKISKYQFFPEFYSRMFNCHWEFYGDCCNDIANKPQLFNVTLIGDLKNIQEPKIIGIWSKNKDNCICGMFIETGQNDNNGKVKREFVKKLVKDREHIKIFGKWHPLNGDLYNKDDKDVNNVDALFDSLLK